MLDLICLFQWPHPVGQWFGECVAGCMYACMHVCMYMHACVYVSMHVWRQTETDRGREGRDGGERARPREGSEGPRDRESERERERKREARGGSMAPYAVLLATCPLCLQRLGAFSFSFPLRNN